MARHIVPVMDVQGKQVLVVGAGIAGLLCATILRRRGASVRVVEKGRGFGGRMATRRMAGARLDHGAQFFTVRTPEFAPWVEEWLGRGWIREWFRQAPWDSHPAGHPRYCGINGMTDVAKGLAGDLEVVRSTRIESARWSPEGWVCADDEGGEHGADVLVLTAPVPQSVAILEGSGIRLPADDWERMRAVDYEPCLTALLILDGPSGLPEPGGVKPAEGPVAWLGDNSRKGISPDVSAVTVHSTPAFAREHWDSADEVRLPLLLEAASEHLSAGIGEASTHRWRFNVPLSEPWEPGFYWSEEFFLGLAGDGFGGPRVEGSAVSGIRLGERIGG